MRVENILPVLRERLATVQDNATIMDAAKLLCTRHINLVIVCNNNGTMTGVITKTDILRHISHCHGSSCTKTVTAVMTGNVSACHPSDLLQDVWSLMKERNLLHIPVISQDCKPLGVVNARDALFELLSDAEHDESLLRDYIMGIGYL